MSDLNQRLAAIAAQLAGVAETGLIEPPTIYERDNFREAGEIAAALREMNANGALDDFQPLDAPLPESRGPAAVGDAAVIDDQGRLLLIRRADSGKWALPGGALEVGETAVDGVLRETREEAGVIAAPLALAGIHDSRFRRRDQDIRLFQTLVLCAPRGETLPYHPHEVLDSGWFALDQLPEPLEPSHRRRIPAAIACWKGAAGAVFE
jgi:ADP-ribose pyrophosphatase YjhB (NUDIX family)